MVKILKYFQILFLRAQLKQFGTLNATQKTAALYKAPFLKKEKWENCLKLVKNAFFVKSGQFMKLFRGKVLDSH